MPGNCAIYRGWITGDLLTASDLTTSMSTVGVTNMTPTCLDDYSTDTNQMRSTANPYPGSIVSLPTSTAGEFERIRYILKTITGWSQWYANTETIALPDPVSITTLNVTGAGPHTITGSLKILGLSGIGTRGITVDATGLLAAVANPIFGNTAGVANRVAIWNSATTLRLDDNLTWDGVTLNINGTVASALWHGTVIGAQYGGTGLNTSASTGVPIVDAGTWSIPATLTAAKGGTAQDTSAWNGIPTIAAGVWTQNNVLTATRLLFAGALNTISSSAGLTWSSPTLTLGVGSTTTGELAFLNATNANILKLKAGVTGGALTFTLPIADGTPGQVLKTDGSGVLSFVTPSTGSTPPVMLSPVSASFPTSNFPQLAKNVGTNWTDYTLDFDDTTAETAYWEFMVPTGATFTTATMTIYYRVASATTNAVVFEANTLTRSDAEAWDTAGNTDAFNASTVPGTAGQVRKITKALTTTGWAAGELLQARIKRLPADAGDTLVGDCKLIAAEISLA